MDAAPTMCWRRGPLRADVRRERGAPPGRPRALAARADRPTNDPLLIHARRRRSRRSAGTHLVVGRRYRSGRAPSPGPRGMTQTIQKCTTNDQCAPRREPRSLPRACHRRAAGPRASRRRVRQLRPLADRSGSALIAPAMPGMRSELGDRVGTRRCAVNMTPMPNSAAATRPCTTCTAPRRVRLKDPAAAVRRIVRPAGATLLADGLAPAQPARGE